MDSWDQARTRGPVGGGGRFEDGGGELGALEPPQAKELEQIYWNILELSQQVELMRFSSNLSSIWEGDMGRWKDMVHVRCAFSSSQSVPSRGTLSLF